MQVCPIDKAALSDNGLEGAAMCFDPCLVCGREWYYLGKEKNLASRPRRVHLVAPLVEGSKIDDCIKPVKEH